jgi:DUF1680 family protein
MKWSINTTVLVIMLLACISISNAQTVDLPKECKYKYGDDINWASKTSNDINWDKKLVGSGFHFDDRKDNYIWFRIKVVIPSNMRAQAEHGKGVQLFLGKIDDIDQTYFNGKLVGQTGSFPPNYVSKYQSNRQYNIPVNEVQWDKENLIAIRVFSPDGWFGLYEGPYKLAAAQWSDFISISQDIIRTNNNGFVTKLKFTNNSTNSFEGTINYRILDNNRKQLFAETKRVSVAPKFGDEQVLAFTNYQSSAIKIARIIYSVKENSSSATISNEHIFLVDKKMVLEVQKEPKPVVINKIKDLYESVAFNQLRMDGYLGNRMTQNLMERLLKIDEPGTMDGYIEKPGHHPWAGEHVGKYLETASNVWRYTGNAKLKMQMDQIMLQLISSQLPDGYLGTYAPADYWTSWDVWSHKYNLYGLLAYYKTTGYTPALDACKKMGDLLCKTFGNKPGQRDIILAGTHIGMAATSVLDPMVELYRYTGDKKYLDFCYYILEAWDQENGPKVITAMLATGNVTKVGNGKAYEMLSNFVGLAKLYRVTGDEKFLKVVKLAWQDIVQNRLYISGTTSSREYFQLDNILPASSNDNMGEGCVTTTWVQLNENLFDITGDLKYLEQIEKTIYNQLLGAENPQTGCVSYYTSLMDAKPYSCDITCCTSSVPRGIAMIPNFTIGNLKNIPTMLLYEAGVYKDSYTAAGNKKVDLLLKVESNFPESGNFKVTINTSSNIDSIPIAFRVPSWCSAFVIKVGVEEYKKVENNCVTIKRVWTSGEKMTINFDIPLNEISGGKSYAGKTAFQRGPQVLTLDESLNQELLKANAKELGNAIWSFKPIETSCPELLPKQWIGKQAYSLMLSSGKKLILVPFADASQTGASIKVWMPLKPIE